MFFNQDSTLVLKAQLTGTVAASQPEISVTYRDNTGNYHPDAIVATNNTTAVTLLSAPSSGVINIVELIKIYNPDTQANTVQIVANSTVIFTCTVGAGQSAVLSSQGINGLAIAPADTDLDNLTSTGKSTIAKNAMPSNSSITVTLASTASNFTTGSTYTAPANGYFSISTGALTASNGWLYMANGNIKTECGGGIGAGTNVYVPCQKGQSIFYSWYGITASSMYGYFTYAQGEE